MGRFQELVVLRDLIVVVVVVVVVVIIIIIIILCHILMNHRPCSAHTCSCIVCSVPYLCCLFVCLFVCLFGVVFAGHLAHPSILSGV